MALKTIPILPEGSIPSPEGNAALKKINADSKVEAAFMKAIVSGDDKTTALILTQHGFKEATPENIVLLPSGRAGGTGGTLQPAMQLPCKHILKIESYKDKQGRTVYVITCSA